MTETWAIRLQGEGRPCCTRLRSLLRRPQVLEDAALGEALRRSVWVLFSEGRTTLGLEADVLPSFPQVALLGSLLGSLLGRSPMMKHCPHPGERDWQVGGLATARRGFCLWLGEWGC